MERSFSPPWGSVRPASRSDRSAHGFRSRRYDSSTALSGRVPRACVGPHLPSLASPQVDNRGGSFGEGGRLPRCRTVRRVKHPTIAATLIVAAVATACTVGPDGFADRDVDNVPSHATTESCVDWSAVETRLDLALDEHEQAVQDMGNLDFEAASGNLWQMADHVKSVVPLLDDHPIVGADPGLRSHWQAVGKMAHAFSRTLRVDGLTRRAEAEAALLASMTAEGESRLQTARQIIAEC